MIPYVIPETVASLTVIPSGQVFAGGYDALGYDLVDALQCDVSEEINGLYDLELTYPAMGANADKLVPEAIIATRINDEGDIDFFRISNVYGTTDGQLTVAASHISYELSGRYLYNISIDARRAQAYLDTVLANSGYTGHSDLQNVIKVDVGAPTSLRSLLFSDQVAGEYQFIRHDVYLVDSRGAEKSMVIGDGDDLISLRVDWTSDGLYTDVLPYVGYDNLFAFGAQVTLVNSPMVKTRIYPLDLSDTYQDLSVDNPPSVASINTRCQIWLNAHQVELTTIIPSHSASLIPLWYNDRIQDRNNRLELGDTVTVEYKPLGVNYTGRIVKTVYDALDERFSEMTIGEDTQDFVQAYAEQVHTTSSYPRQWEEAITETEKLNVSWYGTTSSGASDRDKVVACTGFKFVDGAVIAVRSTNANTYKSNSLRLNVNGTGAKAVRVNQATTSSSNPLLWQAGETIYFICADSGYTYLGSDNRGVWDSDGDNTAELTANGLDIETASMETTLGSGLKQTSKSTGEYTSLGYRQLSFCDGTLTTALRALHLVHNSGGTAETSYTITLPTGVYLLLHAKYNQPTAAATGAQLAVIGSSSGAASVVTTLSGSGTDITATTGTRSQVTIGTTDGDQATLTWTVQGRTYRRLEILRVY